MLLPCAKLFTVSQPAVRPQAWSEQGLKDATSTLRSLRGRYDAASSMGKTGGIGDYDKWREMKRSAMKKAQDDAGPLDRRAEFDAQAEAEEKIRKASKKASNSHSGTPNRGSFQRGGLFDPRCSGRLKSRPSAMRRNDSRRRGRPRERQ